MATTVDTTGQYLIERVEAQRNSTLIQMAALLGAGVCIALAAMLQAPINAQRKQLDLVIQSDVYKELPPEYAWVSAAGAAFRGLAVDLLWMRADKLKEEGKYYESHQLAKWICTLQPRFAAVWSFQAWNMSYNISVATHTAPERWQWVYNGIRLLRDEGIPNNDRVIPLYHQLAWTWFHKVGDRMDDFHWSYKREWASYMETLLGPPPADVTSQDYIAWFKPVAEAPRRLDDVRREHPGVAALIAGLADLGVDVNAETDTKRLRHPLEEQFFKPYAAWMQEQKLAALRTGERQLTPEEQRRDEVFKSLDSPDGQALLAYLRAKVLREQYKMDPKFMLDLTGRLGTDEPLPIDWRTPWSQAMYWAFYGVDKGEQVKNVKPFDVMNTDRLVLFSLATLAKNGRLVFRNNPMNPRDSFLDLMPDLRFVEAMHRKYLELGKKHAEPGEDVGNTAGEMLASGHVNNLHSAVVALYLAGKEEEARKYLEYLAINYKELDTRETKKMYLGGLEEFVLGQIKEMEGSYGETMVMLYPLMDAAYMALVAGSASEFAGSMEKAAWLYKRYQQDKWDDRQGRRTLPPFEQLRATALAGFVTNQGYSENSLIDRSLVWHRELDEIKRRAYDFVSPQLKAECEAAGIDFNRAFPEPEGMAQWRAEQPASRPEDVVREAERIKRQNQQNR